MAYRGLRNNMEAEEKKRLETEWFNKHRENRNNIDKTYIDILSDKPMFEKIETLAALEHGYLNSRNLSDEVKENISSDGREATRIALTNIRKWMLEYGETLPGFKEPTGRGTANSVNALISATRHVVDKCPCFDKNLVRKFLKNTVLNIFEDLKKELDSKSDLEVLTRSIDTAMRYL